MYSSMRPGPKEPRTRAKDVRYVSFIWLGSFHLNGNFRWVKALVTAPPSLRGLPFTNAKKETM